MPPERKPAVRVRWTDAEINLLYAAAIPEARRRPGTGLVIVLNDVQSVLPADRRRRLAWVRQFKRWEELQIEIMKPAPKPRPEAEPPPGGEPAAVQAELEVVLKPEEAEPPVVVNIVRPDVTQTLADISTDRLFVELIRRLQVQAAELLGGVLTSHLSKLSLSMNGEVSSSPMGNGPAPAKGHRQKIAVIGLLADQFRHVQDRVNVPHATWELCFHDKDRRPNLPPVEFAIIQRHSPHTWWDAAQKSAGRVFFVPGGVDAVAAKITQIIGGTAHD